MRTGTLSQVYFSGTPPLDQGQGGFIAVMTKVGGRGARAPPMAGGGG